MSGNNAAGRERVSAFLRSRMAERGFGLTELARAAKVDPGTVSDFVAGTRWPTLKTRSKIEDALGVTYGTLDAVFAGVPEDSVPSAQPSEATPNVSVVAETIGSRTGRPAITVKAEAIGVTMTIEYDGPDDRRRALSEAMWALGITNGGTDEGLLHTDGGDQ